MNPLFPHSNYRLNSTTIVFQQEWFWHWISHKDTKPNVLILKIYPNLSDQFFPAVMVGPLPGNYCLDSPSFIVPIHPEEPSRMFFLWFLFNVACNSHRCRTCWNLFPTAYLKSHPLFTPCKRLYASLCNWVDISS